MSKKPYKRLLGNRLYVDVPERKKSKLEVDANTKEALQREMLKKMSKLKVYDVGELVTNINPGDEVLVDPSKLKDAHLIPLEENKDVLLISPFDVIHVW
jgi:hypothetical protein